MYLVGMEVNMQSMVLIACLSSIALAAEPELSPKERRQRAAFAQAALVYTPIEELGTDGVSAKLDERMDGAPGERLVMPEMKSALAERLSEQIIVRSKDVDAYLAFVDRSQPRWITPEDDREWFIIESSLQVSINSEPGDRSDPRGALETLARRSFEHTGAFEDWASGADGSAIVFFETDDADDLTGGVGYELRPRAVNDAAIAGGVSSALHAWYPALTGEDLLARDGGVVCADAMLMIKRENGTVIAWNTVWVWDPQGETWVCARMGRWAIKGSGVYF